MKIASIQMNVQGNKQENIRKAIQYVEQAADEGAKLVCLPEYVDYMGDDDRKGSLSEPIPGPTSDAFSEIAKKRGIYINCGSILEKAEEKRSYNTSLLFNDSGEIIASYRKTHPYDAEVDGKISYMESDTIKPGDSLSIAETPFGTVGLSICYDVRFPELYRSLALKGAKIIFIPSAFPVYTGYHHWELLVRTRAVENQCFIVATEQYGEYISDGKVEMTFGHSMIVDPWGTVLAKAPDEEGIIYANVQLDRVDAVREMIPCFKHRRPSLYQTVPTNNKI